MIGKGTTGNTAEYRLGARVGMITERLQASTRAPDDDNDDDDRHRHDDDDEPRRPPATDDDGDDDAP